MTEMLGWELEAFLAKVTMLFTDKHITQHGFTKWILDQLKKPMVVIADNKVPTSAGDRAPQMTRQFVTDGRISVSFIIIFYLLFILWLFCQGIFVYHYVLVVVYSFGFLFLPGRLLAATHFARHAFTWKNYASIFVFVFVSFSYWLFSFRCLLFFGFVYVLVVFDFVLNVV